MRVANVTGLLAGYKAVARTPPSPELMVVVRGRFALQPGGVVTLSDDVLEQGMLTGDVLVDEDDPAKGIRYPDDFADFKPKADVLLVGTAHAPAEPPTRALEVRFQVGDWSKRIWVVGERQWVRQAGVAMPSEAAPFRSIPLSWERAFGGPDHAPNPVGCGLDQRVPNLELVGELLQRHGQRLAPAGFGPISPAWEPRLGALRKGFGRDAKPSGFWPAGFDFEAFQAAPPDQRLEGYLRGDERLQVTGLHEVHATYETQLPGLRPRVFVTTTRDTFDEVPLVLDTLLVDMDAEEVTLCWRGLHPIEEDDLSDVRTVLVACEAMADEPRAVDHYRAEMARFEADPVGESLPRDQPLLRQGWKSLHEGPADGADPVDDLVERRMSMLPEGQRRQVQAALRRAFALRADDTTVGAAVAAAMARPSAGAGTGASDARVSQALRALRAKLRGAEKPDLATIEAARALDDPRLAPLDATGQGFAEDDLPEVEPGPDADLRGRDLSEQDLSGRDLQRADLRGANLTRTHFAGADLRGARLSQAILHEANLEGADLGEADVTQAVMSGVRGQGVRLEGAVLTGVVLEGADLRGANLDGVRSEGPAMILRGVDLSGATARGAQLFKVIALESKLEGADFSDAHLEAAGFVDAAAEGARFDRAVLAGASFERARLGGASFVACDGTRAVFIGASMRGATFERAQLRGSHWIAAEVEGSVFSAADLRGGQLARARFFGCDFRHANLMDVDFRRAELEEVSFVEASLYAAHLVDAVVQRCRFDGANLERARTEVRA